MTGAATMPSPARPPAVLAALRRRIAAIERRAPQFDDDEATPGWRLGLDAVDDALPDGRLANDGLHDLRPAEYQDGAATIGFALALASRLPSRDGAPNGPVLWCQNRRCARSFGRLYGPGLAAFGLDAGRLIVLQAERDRDVLWAMEEGLAARALGLVVGELEEAGFTASRRLSLAAQDSRTPALTLQDHAAGRTSAALTRWRVSARPSGANTWDARAPGLARWGLTLIRCRGGRPGAWDVEWSHETHRFRLAAALADRPAAPQPVRPALRHAG